MRTDNNNSNMRMAGNNGNMENNGEMRNNMNSGMAEGNAAYDRVESAFRDRRGRRHYDDGRFAPQNGWEANIVGDNMRDNMESRYDGNARNIEYPSAPQEAYHEPPRMNRIGFDSRPEVETDYRSRINAPVYNEGASMSGKMENGHASSSEKPTFSKEMAEKWTKKMKNEDGTKGPHWSIDQVRQFKNQYSVKHDLYELWVTMNMLYSDYCKAAKKLDVNKVEFYLEMAKAFLDDEDAVDEKLAAYYECVVKHT